MKKRKKYTISDKRILADLKKSNITFGMKLEMARKYNQGDTTFAKLATEYEGVNSRQRAEKIVNHITILSMDIELLERYTKIAQENNLF